VNDSEGDTKGLKIENIRIKIHEGKKHTGNYWDYLKNKSQKKRRKKEICKFNQR
jgi:hypothetical protein